MNFAIACQMLYAELGIPYRLLQSATKSTILNNSWPYLLRLNPKGEGHIRIGM